MGGEERWDPELEERSDGIALWEFKIEVLELQWSGARWDLCARTSGREDLELQTRSLRSRHDPDR